MDDLNEARRSLEIALGEDLTKQYFSLLKKWFVFCGSITKIEFDMAARKLILTDEQVRCHNAFLLTLYNKISSNHTKSARSTCDKGSFELADITEYISPTSPGFIFPNEIQNRNAAAELFLPDNGFITARIAVHAWENGLEGAAEGVTEVVVQACQTFVRNIITAMISKKQGYKIRDGKFQYGFGVSVPDPFLRNTSNIIDTTQESRVEVSDEDDAFVPAYQPSLESAEQQVAFAYSCGKRRLSDGKLNLRLLYDTLRENHNIIGLASVYDVNLLKIGLMLEET